MEVTFASEVAVEIEAHALSTFVAQLGFVTDYGLACEEVPQHASASIALLNVTGWCAFADSSEDGVCVMLAGLDASGELLWACCVMVQARSEQPQQMLESLLISPAVLGKTTHVAIRVYGGRFDKHTSVEPGAAANRPRE